jgi:hypothetical protein
MPTFEISTDKGTYHIEADRQPTTEEAQQAISSQNYNSQYGGSKPVDFGDNSEPMPTSTQTTPDTISKLSGWDEALNVAGQAGKSVYNNPLWHPGLRVLANMAGVPADQIYQSLNSPNTTAERIGSIGGSVAAALPLANPLIKAAGSIPVLGQSAIASGALGMGAYGAAEAAAGGENIGEGFKRNAEAGAIFGLAGRLGSTIMGKVMPKGLPLQKQMQELLPGFLKQAATPEGVGAGIANYIAGSALSPDDDKIAAGSLYAALAVLTPPEQYKLMQGIGAKMGPEMVKQKLGMFSRGQQVAGEIYMQDPQGADAAGTFRGPNGETSANVAASNVSNGIKAAGDLFSANLQQELGRMEQEVKTDKVDAYDPRKGSPLFTKLSGIVNSINIPNAIKSTFNELSTSLIRYGIDGQAAVRLGIAPKDFKGDMFYVNKDVLKSLPSELATKALENTSISPTGLENLRQRMGDLAHSNNEYNYKAGQIAKEVSGYLKGKSDVYDTAMQDYSKRYNMLDDLKSETGATLNQDGTLDTRQLSENLSQNYLMAEDTARGNRDRFLKKLDSYFNDLSDEKNLQFNQFTSKRLIDKYLAYESFNKPQSAGITKVGPLRLIAQAATGGIAGLVTGSGAAGGVLGGLTAYHLSSPESWIPIMKGAATTKGKGLLARLIGTNKPFSKSIKKH